MQLALYNSLLFLGGPLLRRHLKKRLALGKEDPQRFQERLGHPGLPRPEGQLIWIHAASVGESVSALALIDGLLAKEPARHVLVTTGTRTSAEIMIARLPAGAFHQYVPLDMKQAVCRFLDHWRPDLAIWMESEIWPNLIMQSGKRHIPMMMVNARITEKSFEVWRKSFGLSRKLLRNFDFCSAQSDLSADRLRQLGASPVECLGNLKFAAEPLPVDTDALEIMQNAVNGRPLWLAASTHRGEEAHILAAHQQLSARWPDLLTLIVPRHPERGEEIAALFVEAGLTAARRSLGEGMTEETAIYVADTIGELGLFYRLSGIVFIGGSLVPNGGQNPLEAARLDCALLHGPHMDNFADVMAAFSDFDAATEVDDAAALAEVVTHLVGQPAERDEMAARAAKVVATGQETLTRSLSAIEGLLARRQDENS
ncbi:MAG: 3-deoxy-D-manno-octulosonic acid transferase [Sneathiella sp.]|uniref:3-deoxy-D-manno-octulosonic acid transferase n=1 Tax=Sneathiella sp. TaxID=1964365 RepID=UPI000C3F186C|nr:3-deoxy-D-manno-octulosonic acid transferase [Sneathiella sp.]MAZ03851.1 3-deoxy-D-manno-octulosonic acid transferase [Sneathiella sp.]